MANDVLIDEYFRKDPKPASIIDTGGDVFRGNPAPSYGYHPMRFRMLIMAEAPANYSLTCDYDPSEFTETHNMDWESTPVTGKSTTPIAFKTVNPREWSMKLFFNTLGDNEKARSESQERTVRGALDILRKMANPSFYGGANAIDVTTDGNSRPPTLVVFLTDGPPFRCVITKMSITTKAIHPTTRIPTRAEVDIAFTEFVESSA
jgi:hypothetical protein